MAELYHMLQVFVLVSLATSTSGKDCLRRDACSCGFDDGSGFVDLTSLGKGNLPAFQDVYNSDENVYYSYSPCGAFTEGQCTGAAACMSNSDKTEQITIGEAMKAMFKYDENSGNVEVGYTAGSGVLTLTTVELICDPTACEPQFQALGQQASSQYAMSLTSVCACPGKCTASGAPNCNHQSSGLSGGTILIITFLCLVVVYFTAGVLVNMFVKKESGSNLIPNKSVWTNLPGHIVVGFRFTLHKCMRKEGTYTAM